MCRLCVGLSAVTVVGIQSLGIGDRQANVLSTVCQLNVKVIELDSGEADS